MMSADSSLRAAARISSGTRAGLVVVARTVEEVEGLRGEWQAAGVGDIDSDIDYFLAVVTNAPQVVRPHVVLIRRPGRRPLLAVARLELLGVPLAVGYRTVARPQVRAVVVSFGGLVGVAGAADEKLLAGELRRALVAGEADMLLVRKADVGGTVRDAVADGVSWPRRSHAQPVTRRWVAPVPGSFEVFLTHRKGRTRQKLRRYARVLERAYGQGLRVRRFEHPAEMAELCADMEAVAARTYQRGLGAAYSGSPLDQGLIELGLRRGWYRAWMLYLDGKPAAFWTGTAYAGVFTTGTPGYDPEHTKDRVGTYTMLRMIEDLCAAGDVSWLNFGPGDAEYKAAYGTPERAEADIFVVRRGLRPVTVSLTAGGLSKVNSWGRQLTRDTGWGRRLKRAWRGSMTASHTEATEGTDDTHRPLG
jgi:CelD/BcsL family acetyltransferase involved in cellulose biosynthesis